MAFKFSDDGQLLHEYELVDESKPPEIFKYNRAAE